MVNKHNIKKCYYINNDIEVYLLNIDDNLHAINFEFIPQQQVNEISLYHNQVDRLCRLLARSFLYNYLFLNYGVKCFNLEYNEYSKPYLKNHSSISFSFSYSKNYVCVGISNNKSIGVDIEYIDTTLNIVEIAPIIMHELELLEFNSLIFNKAEQFNYFFRLFSAKEAIIKSFGTGLYFDVKNLNILECKNNVFTYNYNRYKYQNLKSPINNFSLSLSYEVNNERFL